MSGKDGFLYQKIMLNEPERTQITPNRLRAIATFLLVKIDNLSRAEIWCAFPLYMCSVRFWYIPREDNLMSWRVPSRGRDSF